MQNFNNSILSNNEALLLEKELTEIINEFIWDDEILESAILHSSIIKLSNKILDQAIERNASAIHLEHLEDSLRIRFRIDDVLHQLFQALPKKVSAVIIARFKMMADLDIALESYPQYGIIQHIYQGCKVDFLIETLPARYGEKIVLRRRYRSSIILDLDKLITDRESLQLIKAMISHPFGLILVTGAGTSGITTTLYSLLAELNKPNINICATSDYLEYSLPGITQVEPIREKGFNFPYILRTFMRQDPDVILVDETRCSETAKTVIEAAERCLVLTRLHSNDAPSAIARLDEMGIEPFMFSHVLIGVIAQRLLRRVCPNCAISYTPTTEELSHFGAATLPDKITIYKANTRKERLAKKFLGNCCFNCDGIGYKGFVGVYQLMPITSRIKTSMNQGLTTDMIYQIAEAEGMKSFLDYSLYLLWQKHTTLDEVNRLVQNEYYWGKRRITNTNKLS